MVYLAAVPLFPRTRRFGNPYAFATIDAFYAFLWFVAWICIATYVGAGKSKGANDQKDDKDDDKDKDKKSGCDAFAYGSPAKCRLSTGTCILGVFVLYVSSSITTFIILSLISPSILFVVTAFMSIRDVMNYRRTGTMPYDGTDPSFAAQSKAAFSSNPGHDLDDDEERDSEFRTNRYGDGGVRPGSSHRGDEDEYALLQQSEVDDMGPHGSKPTASYDPTAGGGRLASGSTALSGGGGGLMHDYDTSYGGPYSQDQRPHGYGNADPYAR